MRREVRTPPAGPASTCSRCLKAGIVSDDQQNRTQRGKGTPLNGIRFHCQCGAEWIANRQEAEEHGRFVARLAQGHSA